ncbi:MAG: chromosome segregation protein SMC, partial [Clostridia bacterium]|nr:chromosome segregation protein SMC [Clostridia bacterium]
TRLFDIEYEEVAMTRRLYRSGESEYLLNMQPCRLKDIVALLHGVGIGKEGYSIIGQGKVEQIMNAKPEDRRAIFEEATGVMKFKSEKAEIERKLDNSMGNLMTLDQRIDELERQRGPLEKQSATARKYKEYSEQLRYEEVNSYLVHYDSFAVETEKYRVRIAEAGEQLSKVETRLTELDGEEEKGREEINKADEQLRSLNEKLRIFEVGMEHKSGEAKVINTRIESYRRQLTQAADDIDYSIRRKQEIDTLVAQNEIKQKASSERAQEIEAESKELFEKLQEADARVAAYERISSEKRASELSSVENLADVRANVGSLSARRDAASERIEEVKNAIAKADARKADFARQLEECRAEKGTCESFLDSKAEREETLKADIADLTASRQKLTEEIVSCNTSVLNLTNNLEIYKNLKNRFDGYRDSVRKLQLTAKENPEIGAKIKGALADIVSTEKKYEVAIETAFGAAMQNLVTATSDDARYLIEYLKRTGGGIVTFLPVSGMRPRDNVSEIKKAIHESGALGLAEELVKYDPYYDNIIKNLLGNTLVCDTIASATQISKKYPNAFKIVTLDGDTIATSGAMTGGSRRKESGNLLAGERHIKECEEGIALKQASLEKLKKALAECEDDLDKAQHAYDEFRVKVQEETAHFAAISQREIALASLTEDAQRDSEEYNGLLTRLTQQIDDIESKVLSSEENEDLLNKIRSEAAEEATKREEEAAKLRAQRDELSDKFHVLQVEGAALKSMREADEETVRRMQVEKKQLDEKVDNSRKAVAEMESLIEQLKRQEEKVALTEEEQHTVGALRERIAQTEEGKRTQNERQMKLTEEKRALLARQMTLGEEKHTYELEISKAETNLENLKQRIEEAYELSYESAQELRDPNYEVNQSQTRITTLKRNITMLGPINHNAEESYNELTARSTEMQTQRDDLSKAIEDSKAILDELKNNMQEKFDKGFNEINQNFTQIFKELFGGGRAEMQLDYENCDDPLNAGVEIVACPPGKKLAKISLLSGGERAFTAIAILFAILKSRPMPFCILDEIEAALDEANVDRFAKYLKKFSRDTQFIVITHRKPTMNQADTLFGVTMEEKGVSKIVSVKLSEVESRLGGDTVI